MQGFRNVLVPLDFSELSEPTLDMAVRVLADDGVATLLHVVEWLPIVTEGAFGVYAHRRDIEQLKTLSLEKLVAYGRARPGARLEPKVSEGKPATVILEEAQVRKPDLIVIGSHGRSGLDHLLIGSVTERVLRKARCAVLVVRAPGLASACVQGRGFARSGARSAREEPGPGPGGPGPAHHLVPTAGSPARAIIWTSMLPCASRSPRLAQPASNTCRAGRGGGAGRATQAATRPSVACDARRRRGVGGVHADRRARRVRHSGGHPRS